MTRKYAVPTRSRPVTPDRVRTDSWREAETLGSTTTEPSRSKTLETVEGLEPRRARSTKKLPPADRRSSPVAANFRLPVHETRRLLANEPVAKVSPDLIQTTYGTRTKLPRYENVAANLTLDVNMAFEEELQKAIEHEPYFCQSAKTIVEFIHRRIQFKSLQTIADKDGRLTANARQERIDYIHGRLPDYYRSEDLDKLFKNKRWHEEDVLKPFMNEFRSDQRFTEAEKVEARALFKLLTTIETQKEYFGGSVEYDQHVDNSLEFWVYHLSTLARDPDRQYHLEGVSGAARLLKDYRTAFRGKVPAENFANLGNGVTDSKWAELPPGLQEQMRTLLKRFEARGSDAKVSSFLLSRYQMLQESKHRAAGALNKPTSKLDWGEVWDHCTEDHRKAIYSDITQIPWSRAHLVPGSRSFDSSYVHSNEDHDNRRHPLAQEPGLHNVAGVFANLLQRPEVAVERYARAGGDEFEKRRTEGKLAQYPADHPETLMERFVRLHTEWYDDARTNHLPIVGGLSGHTLAYLNLLAAAMEKASDEGISTLARNLEVAGLYEDDRQGVMEVLRAIMLGGVTGNKRHHSVNEVLAPSTSILVKGEQVLQHRDAGGYLDLFESRNPKIKECVEHAQSNAERRYMDYGKKSVLALFNFSDDDSTARVRDAAKHYLQGLGLPPDQRAERKEDIVAAVSNFENRHPVRKMSPEREQFLKREYSWKPEEVGVIRKVGHRIDVKAREAEARLAKRELDDARVRADDTQSATPGIGELLKRAAIDDNALVSGARGRTGDAGFRSARGDDVRKLEDDLELMLFRLTELQDLPAESRAEIRRLLRKPAEAADVAMMPQGIIHRYPVWGLTLTAAAAVSMLYALRTGHPIATVAVGAAVAQKSFVGAMTMLKDTAGAAEAMQFIRKNYAGLVTLSAGLGIAAYVGGSTDGTAGVGGQVIAGVAAGSSELVAVAGAPFSATLKRLRDAKEIDRETLAAASATTVKTLKDFELILREMRAKATDLHAQAARDGLTTSTTLDAQWLGDFVGGLADASNRLAALTGSTTETMAPDDPRAARLLTVALSVASMAGAAVLATQRGGEFLALLGMLTAVAKGTEGLLLAAHPDTSDNAMAAWTRETLPAALSLAVLLGVDRAIGGIPDRALFAAGTLMAVGAIALGPLVAALAQGGAEGAVRAARGTRASEQADPDPERQPLMGVGGDPLHAAIPALEAGLRDKLAALHAADPALATRLATEWGAAALLESRITDVTDLTEEPEAEASGSGSRGRGATG
ncbi:MAG TPA: hypothetical protein VF169_01315 [Albitalea sp.]|uniref:hypothetical protein n=1 Tax=Piscinibacter sp. TaxID=1903157 RepID=UPI002ED1ED98